MKNIIINTANKIDTMIPDANPEYRKDQIAKIKEDVKNTAVCLGASLVYAGKTLNDTLEFTAVESKTVVKNAAQVIRDCYNTPKNMVTVRR